MSTRRRSPKRLSDTASENAAINAAVSGPGTGPTRRRETPRNSTVNEDATAAKETPFNDVHRLGQLLNLNPRPATPLRRASSAGPPSTRRSTRRTPITQERTPGGLTQPGSTRRQNAPTPHAQAAAKANELRRAAALTPARDRQRSGRQQQRETPREPLRALSRIMAPTSKAVETTPQNEVLSAGKVLVAGEDDLDGRIEPRPRLSMPLDEDEDDSLLLPPMRSADFVEDDNLTQQSLELPRRAVVGQLGGRLSRGSFGSVRTSDQIGNINELGLEALPADGNDSTFIRQGDFDDIEPTNVEEDVTGNLQHPYHEDGTGRMSMASARISDIRPQDIPEDDTETTFLLPLPQRDSLPGRPSAGEVDESDEDDNDYDGTRDESAEADDDQEGSEVDQVDAEEEDVTMRDPIDVQSEKTSSNRKKTPRIKKRIKISRYGIQYPSLPVGVVKRLATTFLKTSGNGNAKLSKDTLEAIMQASDWFFEQVSDDLGTYAEHASRKTIDETDVVTLMKR
jgi:histone H3/H4